VYKSNCNNAAFKHRETFLNVDAGHASKPLKQKNQSIVLDIEWCNDLNCKTYESSQ
jgi:hypothetical protein